MEKLTSPYKLIEILQHEAPDFLTYPKFIKITDDMDIKEFLKEEFGKLPQMYDEFGKLPYNIAVYFLWGKSEHIYESFPSSVNEISFPTYYHFFIEDGPYASELQVLRMDIFWAERNHSLVTYDEKHYLKTYVFYKAEKE